MNEWLWNLKAISIPVCHDGILLLNKTGCTIHHCTLPTKSADEIMWSQIDLGHIISAMATSIAEHDLVAIIIVYVDSLVFIRYIWTDLTPDI
jgi:hypothetical protein